MVMIMNMNMNMNKLVFYLFFAPVFLLAGCVGSVEEVSAPGTQKLEFPPTTFDFPGIITSRAISHKKVELEFYPSSGSDMEYKLYVNNSSTPLTIDPESLLEVGGGKLLYTVDHLVADREYKFKIVASNAKSNSISKNENETYSRTFDNIVSDFNGISRVSLVPGDTSGSIRIDWIAPPMTGTFIAGPYDPIRYEVILISEIGGSANLFNTNYFGTDKRYELVPNRPASASPMSNPNFVTVNGLAANTRYYVMVRAINSLWDTYFLDPETSSIPVSREMNTKFLSIKTDPAGSLFDFRQDNVILANAPSLDGFDKIDIFWQPGSGSFSGYRIFVRKYDGLSDATIDDKLTEATLHSMNLSGSYYDINTTLTSKRISALENQSHYQVKVALCKTISCPVQTTDPNAAIISDLRAIQVQTALAAFSGINSIQPPGQYSEKDIVNLKFDPPLVTSGYANALEFYCVDPSDYSQMVQLSDGSPISGSPITRCNGLYLSGAIPPIASHSSQKIKGLQTVGTLEYCFAATPAILGFGADVRLDINKRIVRCSYPEVLPPTIAQFSGLNSACAVSGVNGNVTWNLPTGGIYSGFKVFWMEKDSADKFSFPHATANDPLYTNSGILSAATTTYTATGLSPGKTYQIGVLATVDMDIPTPDLYSEYNLKIIDCVVPLPIATFKGFSRIFAVGPKMDGRIPNDQVTKAPPVSGSNNALIYEAIDAKGTPFDVAVASVNSPDISANFTAPPGRDFGVSFAGGFDGASEKTNGYAMSRNGIVSLAWEDVQMDFPEADSLFAVNQPAAPAARTSRKWGYIVYRSSDNKLTWENLTNTNGPVYSADFSYFPRPNVSSVTSRMAFFTDYSVQALTEVHNTASAIDIERARTYYYKIVPVFDGKVLKYTAGNYHIVKVTLPPPNMALVHRWMANRARCLELDKLPNKDSNYACTYNGIAARPKSIPHRVGDTALDQGGDLLVDRHELGCRYTRGEKTATPEAGTSVFALDPAARRHPNDQNFYPLFKGYRTVGQIEDPSTPFRGCVGFTSNSLGATGTGADYPSGFVPEYNRYLQGDCLGSHLDHVASGSCTALQYANGAYSTINVNVPGAETFPGAATTDCSSNPPNYPTNYFDKYTGWWAPNLVMQSEFLAVFYNNYPGSISTNERHATVEGPNVGSLASSRILNSDFWNTPSSASCSINLASIDSSGYMKPRWMSVNELGLKKIKFKNSNPNLLSKTVDELSEVVANTVEPLTLYNGVEGDGTTASFKLPATNLRSNSRFFGSTRISKILSSNSAKLPPLGRVTSEVAETLCGNYYIQTGIASDNGFFSPDSSPKAKRPLRRVESITASAWSETLNSAAIVAVEKSTSSGSCVNSIKNVGNSNSVKGDLLGNIMTVRSPISNIPIVTGSSPYNATMANSQTIHSANCISRYGIQDMVGNVTEANSERIFCDYSQDAIYLGPVTGVWGGGSAAQNVGAGGPDYSFFNLNSERDSWAVLKSGTPTANDGNAFEIRFRSGDSARTDVKPWVKVSTGSGYCSIVDSKPSKRTGATDFFKDVSTGYWNSMFSPGGGLNTSVVERSQNDQEAVKTWRNGDGRYLDFGPSGIGAALSKKDNIALTGATALSKYFNPIIGLPLKCENFSCNDPILQIPIDNTSVTTSALEPNIISGLDDIPAITDWDVGNSSITSLGIADYTYPDLGYTVTTVPMISGGVGSAPPEILQAVLVDDPITMGNPIQITKQFPQDFNPGDPFEYYRVYWTVERGALFGLVSGGGSSASTTGRYTASVTRASAWDGSTDISRGVRCAIMINQD
jgi:hypothetical protein